MSTFKTIHDLSLQVAPAPPNFPSHYKRFRIGTCHGLWWATEVSLDMLVLINTTPGNGHFVDWLQWCVHSAITDRKKLVMHEIYNLRLRKHLIEKRGFVATGKNDADMSYQKLKKLSIDLRQIERV